MYLRLRLYCRLNSSFSLFRSLSLVIYICTKYVNMCTLVIWNSSFQENLWEAARVVSKSFAPARGLSSVLLSVPRDTQLLKDLRCNLDLGLKV